MPARVEPAVDKKPDKKQLGDAEEVLKECAELEVDLNELKAQYEQYFLGLERLPPTKHHERLRRRIGELKGKFIRQTAAKFRVQQLAAKLSTYERLWDRTLKEMEAGTYARDLFKARRRRKERDEKQKKSDVDFPIDEDLDLSDLDGEDDLEGALAAAAAAVTKPAPSAQPPADSVPSRKPATREGPVAKPATASLPGVKPPTGSVPGARPATGSVTAGTPSTGSVSVVKPVTGAVPPVGPPTHGSMPKITAAPVGSPVATPGAGSAPAPRTSANPPARSAEAKGGGDGGLTDQKIKAIYDAYVMAKKRCGEDTRSITLDAVSAALRKQVPELMRQHQAKSVEFKVVIKDGKAILRALPKG